MSENGESFIYVMKPGDTLWDLAAEHLEGGFRWVDIEILSDKKIHHKSIPVGTRVRIPAKSERVFCLTDRARGDDANYVVFSARDCEPKAYFDAPYVRPPRTKRTVSLSHIAINTENGRRALRARKGKFELVWEPDAEADPESIKRDDITLTAALASDDCWSADLKVIAELHRNYSGFLEEIDIHLNSASFLLPETFALVRQHLGETMIASLRDTLYYRYSLNSGLAPNLTNPKSFVKSPYVDLLPGMRVRLEYAQLTSSNGYAATGSGSYTVTRHAPRSSSFIHTDRDRLHEVLTGFNGFLNTIAAPQEINRTEPAAGLLEINESTRIHRHVRLLYPTRDLPHTGVAHLTRSAIILASDSYKELNAATEHYQENAELYNGKVESIILEGRAVLIPEIPIRLNGATQYVSLGTTVRDLLDRAYPSWNPRTIESGKWFSMRRLYLHEDGMPRYHAVSFRPDVTLTFDSSVYDLPLVSGDSVRLAGLHDS